LNIQGVEDDDFAQIYDGIRLGVYLEELLSLHCALTELGLSHSGNTYCGQHQSSLVRLEQDVVGLKEMRCSQVERPLCTSWCSVAVGLDAGGIGQACCC